MTLEDFEKELMAFDYSDCRSNDFSKWLAAERKAATLEKISRQSIEHKELYIKYYTKHRKEFINNQLNQNGTVL